MPTDKRYGLLVEWVSLVLPILCGPLMLFPKLRWMWVLVLIPLSWLWCLRVRGRLFEPTPLNPLLLFLTLMVGISLYVTFDVQFTLAKICGVLLGVFVYLGLVQFVDSDTRLKWVMGAFLTGGFGLTIVALLGTAWWARYPVLARFVILFPIRLKGLPGAEEGFNPNAVGGALDLFIPLILSFAANLHGREKRMGQKVAFGGILLLLLLMGGTLLLCQSRGALLGCASGVVLLLAVRYRWARWTSMVMGGLALLLVVICRPRIDWGGSAGNGFAGRTEFTVAERVEIWSCAIHGIQDFPFTGMGMNVFRKLVHDLYPLSTISPDVDIAHCHSQLLQTALDLGVPGLVAYAAIWAASFRLLWRIRQRTQDPFHRAIALGLAAGLLAQFVFGINDALPLGSKVGIFWWIAIAVTASLYNLQNNNAAQARRRASRYSKVWEVPFLWVLFSLLSVSFVRDHPSLALALAIAGGAFVGVVATKRQPDLPNPTSMHRRIETAEMQDELSS